jgi:DNA polymerase-1
MTYAFDTETHLIGPGRLAPPMVCYSESTRGEACGRLYHARFDRERLVEHVAERIMLEPVIVAANTAYDAVVLMHWEPELAPIIFGAYHDGRVWDVQINQQLIDLSHGRLGGFYTPDEKFIEIKYNLAALVMRHLRKDRSAQKSDPNGWRLRYAELENVPLEHWPDEASDYAVEDAVDARDVLECQYRDADRWEHQAASQARAALALHLLSVEGVHTDPDVIDALEEMTAQRFADLTAALVAEGLVRPSGSRDTKKAKARIIDAYRQHGAWPLTDTGLNLARSRTRELPSPRPPLFSVLTAAERETYASLDAEACEGSGDEVLEMYAKRTSLSTIVKTHIPDLRKGVLGGTPIQSSFQTLMETGRISCRKGTLTNGTQLTNPPRSIEMLCPNCGGAGCAACKDTGEVTSEVGIRECYVAEPGLVFIDGDFPGLELCTVAQACKVIVGYSHLGDAINAGIDVHLDLASQLLGISYKEAHERRHTKEVKDARQLAKPANFGFPGGLGPDGFVGFARGYGVRISPARAAEIKAIWLDRFSEFGAYFAHIRGLCELGGGTATITQLYSNRIRGGASYCAAANTYFQGLGADGAKDALWAVTRACYDPTEESILLGSRPWNFVHDQILAKTADVRDDSHAERKARHDRAVELGRLMSSACNLYLPNYPLNVKPALAYCWTKGAEPVFDRDGLLVPWDWARAARAECFYDDGKAVVW